MSENIMYPGRDNYTGPRQGYFGALHHDRLYEWSNDVFKRVDYVRRKKPADEVPVRLWNMIYLGGCAAVAKLKPLDDDYWAKFKTLDDDHWAKRKTLYDDYWIKRKTLDDDYEAKRKPLYAAVLIYIREHIPDFPWDEEKGELRFA